MALASKEGTKSVDRNGVMITVYVESVTTRSRKLSEDLTNKYLRKQRDIEPQGYDRRALLLAYSRQLRNGGSLPLTKSKGHCSCENELVAAKESKERNQLEKRKSSGKHFPSFLSKIKNMLKQLSCKEI